MKIIKDAFIEGRDTDIDWNKSKARENSIKLDVFTANEDNFNGRAFNSDIRMERIDPKTGDSLGFFSTRLDACKWIAEHVLKITDQAAITKKAQSISGNVHMGIKCGFKAYGFYWKYVPDSVLMTDVVADAQDVSGTPIWVSDLNKKRGGISMFPSYAAAERATGVSARQIRRIVQSGRGSFNNLAFRYLNTKPMTMKFDTMREAMDVLGVRCGKISKSMNDNSLINNILPDVKPSTKLIYRSTKGTKYIKEYKTKKEVMKKFKLTSSQLNKMLVSGQKTENGHLIQAIEK